MSTSDPKTHSHMKFFFFFEFRLFLLLSRHRHRLSLKWKKFNGLNEIDNKKFEYKNNIKILSHTLNLRERESTTFCPCSTQTIH